MHRNQSSGPRFHNVRFKFGKTQHVLAREQYRPDKLFVMSGESLNTGYCNRNQLLKGLETNLKETRVGLKIRNRCKRKTNAM